MMAVSRLHKKNERQGFTLLEVLVAVVILGLAYVAVLQNYSVSLSNVSRIEKSRRGVLSASLAMEAEMLAKEQSSGEPFLEGSKYRLMLITSPDGYLTSLKLERM